MSAVGTAPRFLLRLARYLRPFWPHLTAILVVNLLATPVALLAPLPLKIVVDNVVGGAPLSGWLSAWLPASMTGSPAGPLTFAVLLVLAVAALAQVQGNGAWLIQAWTGERIVLSFRADLFRRVQRLSLAYHDARGTTDSLYRIQYDASALQWIAVYGIAPLVTAAGTLIGMFLVLLYMDATLALVAAAVSPLLLGLTHGFGRHVRARWHQVKELESSVTSVLQEVLGALRVVKAFGQERREEDRFLDRAGREVRANLEVVRAQALFNSSIGLILAGGSAAALFIGVRHVQSGVLTLGDLTMVMAYLAQLYGPLETLSHKFTELQGSMASAERAFTLLDQNVEVADLPGARALHRVLGDVTFRDVRFSYDRRHEVLCGVSVHVPAGTRVGIVGRTGSGKTTLVSLLTRFYDPTAGVVQLDGHDIREWKLESVRRQFAMVLQDPILFSTTIRENIAYGRPEAAERDIVEAAAAAEAHEFILSLPDGYDTQVGERGMLLSGGERQRIALARAFLKDAPILILDEPTSAVDVKTEASIVAAMERLMRGRTTFVIAHRLTTLRHCDVVYVMERGLLVHASVESAEPQLAAADLAVAPGTA